MTYLFEDKDSDILSEFFKLGYKQSDSIKFIGGNASFKRSINRTIKDGDSVAIFFDLSIGNKDTAQLYDSLRIEYADKGVMCIPIPCMEYYYLKHLIKLGIYDSEYANDCINKIPNQNYLRFKNFEKWCKYFVEAKDACYSVGKHGSKIYLTKDCNIGCTELSNDCLTINLANKVELMLGCMECIPAGSSVTGTKKSIEYADIHRKLVDEYNEVTHKFSMYDTARSSNYISVDYWI